MKKGDDDNAFQVYFGTITGNETFQIRQEMERHNMTMQALTNDRFCTRHSEIRTKDFNLNLWEKMINGDKPLDIKNLVSVKVMVGDRLDNYPFIQREINAHNNRINDYIRNKDDILDTLKAYQLSGMPGLPDGNISDPAGDCVTTYLYKIEYEKNIIAELLEEQKKVDAALSRLHKIDQAILKMYHFNKYSHEKIAMELFEQRYTEHTYNEDYVKKQKNKAIGKLFYELTK